MSDESEDESAGGCCFCLVGNAKWGIEFENQITWVYYTAENTTITLSGEVLRDRYGYISSLLLPYRMAI